MASRPSAMSRDHAFDARTITATWVRDAMEGVRRGVASITGPLASEIAAGRLTRPAVEGPPDLQFMAYALGNLLRRRKGTNKYLSHRSMNNDTAFFPLHLVLVGMREASRQRFRVGHLNLHRGWADRLA